MRFIANSQLANGTTADELIAYFEQHEIESSTWDLIRHRVVTEYAFKVGATPGLVLFLEADSDGAAAEIVSGLPVAKEKLLSFEIDPISTFARF